MVSVTSVITGAGQSAAGVVMMSAGQSAHHLYGKGFFKNDDDEHDDDGVCGAGVWGSLLNETLRAHKLSQSLKTLSYSPLSDVKTA